jgi:16S rRNA G527 N7-methylase RsmG
MQNSVSDWVPGTQIKSALFEVGVNPLHIERASLTISHFAKRLIEINKIRNFFSRKLTEQEFIAEHILDGIYAAAALPCLKDSFKSSSLSDSKAGCDQSSRATIIDLGSGPGLPGLILAAMFPANLVVMIERREVPSAFVNEFILERGLKNARVVISDLRSIRAAQFESNCSTWNNELCLDPHSSQLTQSSQRIFVSRAYSPLSELFEGASAIMRPKEQLFFITGANSKILSSLPSNFKSYKELGYYPDRPERILYSFAYRS